MHTHIQYMKSIKHEHGLQFKMSEYLQYYICIVLHYLMLEGTSAAGQLRESSGTSISTTYH